MDPLLCKLSPYLRHTTQSIVIKGGKNNRIVWDGLTVTRPTDIAMNQVTPVAQEAPVTFSHVKSQIYTVISNTCMSYPTATFLLGLADVKVGGPAQNLPKFQIPSLTPKSVQTCSIYSPDGDSKVLMKKMTPS
jgi:hypothetical protein